MNSLVLLFVLIGRFLCSLTVAQYAIEQHLMFIFTPAEIIKNIVIFHFRMTSHTHTEVRLDYQRECALTFHYCCYFGNLALATGPGFLCIIN